MKRFKAYTQRTPLDEKFYIEDENQLDLVIEAEDADDARAEFIDYIFEHSLYKPHETAAILFNNPVHVEEVG